MVRTQRGECVAILLTILIGTHSMQQKYTQVHQRKLGIHGNKFYVRRLSPTSRTTLKTHCDKFEHPILLSQNKFNNFNS